MNNFEEAIKKIEALEEENLNLKVKLKAALWKISTTPVGVTTNIQVGFDDKIEKLKADADIAMEKFSKQMSSEAKKHRERKNGS